jgi:hypothetical protein
MHRRWWQKGPVVYSTNWEPRYPEEEPVQYLEPTVIDIETAGQNLAAIHRQLGPEEQRRYTHQVDIEHQKLLTKGRRHLKLQTIPIGNVDPLPKQQYRKKKNHGKSDARALTGAEINESEQLVREKHSKPTLPAQLLV